MRTTIIRQLNTEKTHKVIENGVYVFLVASDATKPVVKSDIEKTFGVKVTDVRMLTCPKRMKSFRGSTGAMSQYKKAYVSVARGMKIEFDNVVKA